MYRAAGFGKQGGTVGFEQATERLEGGLNPNMLRDLVKQIKEENGEGWEGKRRLATVAGITTSQAGAVMNSASGATSDEDLAKILKSAEPLEKQALEQMKIIGHEALHQSGLMDKGIAYGAKIAPSVEKMEALLDRALLALIQIAEDVGAIAEWVKKLAGGTDADRKKSSDATLKAIGESDPAKRAALLKEASAAASRAAIDSGDTRLGSRMLGGIGRNVKDVFTGKKGFLDATLDPFGGMRDKDAEAEASAVQAAEANARQGRDKIIAAYQGASGVKTMSSEMQSFLDKGGSPPLEISEFNARRNAAVVGAQGLAAEKAAKAGTATTGDAIAIESTATVQGTGPRAGDARAPSTKLTAHTRHKQKTPRVNPE
jgi:hypothetical protein